ncbi:MAG: ATP-binding protein, partial [Eubacteriales bacterium]|nr:ATP-binding protein [Eubacteriales bacterium]
GFPEDYLQPVYECDKCRDTGYIGDGIQEMCQCLKKRLYEDYGREMGLCERQKQTFQTFSLSVFPQEVIPDAGVSQRALMQVIKKRCEKFADDFPETQTDNLLLYGASGLGKTFLMHAIAHRVIERGYSVLIISAYRMFELMRRAHRDGDDAGLQPLFDAELLLIDDLGTEPMMENITVIQLFNLLNERAVRRLHTAVCTNLTPKELQERYTERVTSRLLDRQSTMQLYFAGRDIRLSER